MGFGSLFIGYFLLLNLTYYGFTDLIAALLMTLAFYKLRGVNDQFRIAIIPSSLFAIIGAIELFEALASMSALDISFLLEYTATSRYLLIGAISIFMLMGIERVAEEVGANKTRSRAKTAIPLSYALFALAAIFEFPAIGSLMPEVALGYTAIILLLLLFALMIYIAVAIYSAYMHICMPEDTANNSPDKPSRFGFVNKFREYEEGKSREYAEYRLEKMKKKAEKKKRKK